ncbi:MAG: RNA recognition motif domain-containing protein [Flavisolibacter sp.]
MHIYISNLEVNVKDQELKDLFQPFGEVVSAEVQNDGFTGKSRGFGYVEMKEEAPALQAIKELNHSAVHGLEITVSQTQKKQVHEGSYKVGSGPINFQKFKRNPGR